MNFSFLPWLVDHLWQSTLCAGAAGLLALAFRKNSAAVRYRLWLVASVKFLIPFSLLVNLGGYLAPYARTAKPVTVMTPIEKTATAPEPGDAKPLVRSPIDRIAEPLAMVAPVAAPATAFPVKTDRSNRTLSIVVAIWFCGFAVQMFFWIRQWWSIRAKLRAAVPLEIDVPALIPAMSSPMSIEPSIFGILNPVLLLPHKILENLTPAQTESILLHESAHVRRRDNLGAALHMIVEALFWFNPMVWWIGKRMVEERERACDEDVLSGFDEPGTYAEAILAVCKLHIKTPLACMAGVASSNLRERIENIMNHQEPRHLNVGRRLVLTGLALLVVCGPLFLGIVRAGQLSTAAQSAFTYSSIDVPGAISTVARGLNGIGRVVGSFTDSNGTHGFLYSNGTFTAIDVPGATWTIATGINNAGQIVGAYGTGAETGNHGFLLNGGSFSFFDYPGSLDTVANGINNRGQIVGTYLGSDGFRHGFRLSGGNYTLIEVPEMRAGSAEGINDAGQIVGLSGYGAAAVGFVFGGGSFSKLQLTPNVYADAKGLNNLGDIVGQNGGPQEPYQGFLRSEENYSALNLPGNPFSWNVRGINDLGQIIGEFSDRDGRTHGYLATPTAFRTSPATNDATRSRLTTDLGPTAIREAPALTGPQGPQGPQGPPGPPGPPGPAAASAPMRPLNRGDADALPLALNRVANGILRSIGFTNPGNLERARHLSNAQAAVERAVANAEAAAPFVKNAAREASVPGREQPLRRFQLPADLQGVDPGLGIAYDNLNIASEALARSPGGDLGGYRAKIGDDIATMAQEMIAALAASRDFNVTGRGRGARGLIPAAENRSGSASAVGDATNVLSRIEITNRSSTGSWTLEQSGLTVGPDNWARLCLPWHPIAGEYEVLVEFTRQRGNEGFGLFLTPGVAPNQRFLFQLSAVGNQWVMLNGVRGGDVRQPVPFGPNGTRHSLRARVLRSSFEAYLDGELIFRYETDYKDFQPPQDWGFGTCGFGLVSWYNVITFHRIEVKGG